MRIASDGRRFRAVSNVESGDVTTGTTFHYRQAGDVVWGTYEGGGVAFGTLIAQVDEAGQLDMRYQQVSTTGQLRAGRCRSVPEVLADGRLRLHETWSWTEGGEGSGTSTVEEMD